MVQASRPRRWAEIWRSKNPRVAAARELLLSAFVLLVVLGGIWAYTGQSFPHQAPLVVVESGSMMHGPHGPCLDRSEDCATFPHPPKFGRVGTIDPGDLVLVKTVSSLDDVEAAFGAGKRGGYGGHGDVVVYKRTASGSSPPIIHRAMLHVLVDSEGCTPNGNDAGQACRFRIPEACGPDFGRWAVGQDESLWRPYCEGSDQPITLTLVRDGLFLRLSEYPCRTGSACGPFYSGILTKGDNNPYQDQLAGPAVNLEEIVGKARGEIPWFGLIKLALRGNPRYASSQDPTHDAQWKIFKALAPWDIWVSLFLAIGALMVIPMAVDGIAARIRRRRSPPEGSQVEPDEEPLEPSEPKSPPEPPLE